MLFKLILDENCREEIIANVHKRTPLIDQIEQLVSNNNANDQIVAYNEDEIVVLNLHDVECFAVEDEKTYAINQNGDKFQVKKRLYELESGLPGNYERISKSAIANHNKIKKYKVQLSGAVDAVFESGYVECISRRCFAQIKRRLKL